MNWVGKKTKIIIESLDEDFSDWLMFFLSWLRTHDRGCFWIEWSVSGKAMQRRGAYPTRLSVAWTCRDSLRCNRHHGKHNAKNDSLHLIVTWKNWKYKAKFLVGEINADLT